MYKIFTIPGRKLHSELSFEVTPYLQKLGMVSNRIQLPKSTIIYKGEERGLWNQTSLDSGQGSIT